MDRRLFLGGLAGALAGCYGPPPAQPLPHPLDLGVDAHVHLFNGRDVPAIGFLRKVVFSGESPLPAGTPLASLAELLVAILGVGTPSAAEELAGIAPRGLADDEASVAAGLDAFMAKMAAPQGLRAADPQRDDALLLDMLWAEAGGGPAPMARRSEAAPSGADLARRIYRTPPQRLRAAGPGLAMTPGLLVAHVRWAGLLTRGRRDLLDEVLRLYRGRGEGQFQVFFASLVDFEYWLEGDDPAGWLSGQQDQLALMSHLSRTRKDALIVNFAPFCPLRAAIEGPAAMARLRAAVEAQGFAGVKLYPPMGFRPTCNTGIAPPGHGVTPQRIEAALAALYRYCAESDVPIQAHANDSMAARPGAGAHASPVYWRRVLRDHPGLRVNLSHAGEGVHGGDAPATACGIAAESRWREVIARTIGDGQSVWFDTGYWTGPAYGGDPAAAIEALRKLARHAPEDFPRRMLYGSDWMMIAREPGFEGYHVGMQRFVEALYPDPAQARGVLGGNALDFLLGPVRGANYRRLARFHAGNAVWERHLRG